MLPNGANSGKEHLLSDSSVQPVRFNAGAPDNNPYQSNIVNFNSNCNHNPSLSSQADPSHIHSIPNASKPSNPSSSNNPTILKFENITHQLSINTFKHSRPIAGTRYFTQNEDKRLINGLGAVIPFYNEPSRELKTTLKSLYDTHRYLCQNSIEWRNKPMNVCIIQDGWYKADNTMKLYLKELFSWTFPDGSHWSDWDMFNNEKQLSKYAPTTVIIEKTFNNPFSYFSKGSRMSYKQNNGCCWSGYTENGRIDENRENYGEKRKLHLTLIIKIDNRKKHNSHEWFLGESGFADAYKCKYLFCTDAFTMFDKCVLYELVNYLDNNKKACGVTGRQRAMNRRLQWRKGVEYTLSFEYMLRLTQIYDFELAGCVFNPTYDLIGFLPVLPGPCGLYRSSDVLQKNVRNWYFDVVNSEPSKTGLILGNLRIAEDRVLSYASVLKPYRYNLSLGYCPRALFYFEAEINLKQFIAQRRRWINGTFAGYWFLLISQSEHLRHWHANIFRKFIVFFIIFLNLLQMMALILSPGFSFIIFYSCLEYLLSLEWPDDSEIVSIVVLLLCWLLWIAHVTLHNKKENKYIGPIITSLFGLSIVMTVCLVATIFIIIAVEQNDIVKEQQISGISYSVEAVLLYLFAFTFIAPFICSFLVDRGRFKGIGLLLKTVIPFFLSFYLMIPWFSSYAFARCWDLSWGNRPGGVEIEHNNNNNNNQKPGNHINNRNNGDRINNNYNEMDDDMRNRLYSDIGETHTEREKMEARFSHISKIVVGCLIAINVAINFIPLKYTAFIMGGLLATSSVFMVVSLLKLLFEDLWMVIKYILCCTCCRPKDRENEDDIINEMGCKQDFYNSYHPNNVEKDREVLEPYMPPIEESDHEEKKEIEINDINETKGIGIGQLGQMGNMGNMGNIGNIDDVGSQMNMGQFEHIGPKSGLNEMDDSDGDSFRVGV